MARPERARLDNRDMTENVQFARMNGLGNKILVVDMRGRKDRVTPAAAIALNADPATAFDQIMAIHDPKAQGTDAWIDIVNCDGSMAQACGNGTRCVVQALAAVVPNIELTEPSDSRAAIASRFALVSLVGRG